MNTAIEAAWDAVWRATWQASLLAAIVLLLQTVLARRLGGRARYALWSIVLLRMFLPILPESRLSIFNLPRALDAEAAVQPAAPKLAGRTGVVADAPLMPVDASPTIRSSFTVPRLLGIAWLCGMGALSLRVILTCIGLNRLKRRLREVDSPTIQSQLASCAARLGLRRLPRVLSGEQVRTPAVVGALRPCLLLPARVMQCCDAHEIRLVLMHELAHLKRHDVAGNWLVTIATIIHWFNPFVWLIASRIRADRELACDELVLSRSGAGDVPEYGRTLIKLIEILSPEPPPKQLVGILESPTPMQRRVQMIAQYDSRRSGRWMWTVLILLGLGCTALTDRVQGDDKPPMTAATTQPRVPQLASFDAADQPQNPAKQLTKIIPELRFENVALSDAIEFIRDVTQMNILVEWKTLEAAGIERNVPVTMRLRHITVEEALDNLVRDLSSGGALIDYTIDRSVVIVSTDEAIANRTSTVFYDVRDLMTTPDGNELTGDDFDKKQTALMTVIRDSIASDSWKDNGGSVSSIAKFNNKLIIRTTTKIHQEIEQLLTRLRARPVDAAK